MEQRRTLTRVLIGLGLLLLASYAGYLALHRIYQVDEAQNVYMARIVGTRATAAYYVNGSLFSLGPLAWITGTATNSTWMWNASRLYALAIFFTNTILLALATGIPLRNRAFPWVLLAAATLAPLWDYGFEIRHDNVILTGLLLSWWLVRSRQAERAWGFAGLGGIAALLQFIAFKSFMYTLPLTAGLILFPPPPQRPRLRLLMEWVGGALLGVLLARAAYGLHGSWETFLTGFRTSFGHAIDPGRFPAWDTLARLVYQVPLLLIGGLAVLWISLRDRLRNRIPFSWEGSFPELLLLLMTLGLLLANPVPYAYNLVLLVPFLFLAIARWGTVTGWESILPSKRRALIGVVLASAHLVPFGISAERHLAFPNERQKLLMTLAESMTGPEDPVYDGAGLVAARPSIHYQWFLHSLVMAKYRDGRLPPLAQTLAERPAPVLIRSYRTDWISAADHDFILEHYLALSDDFLVLGALVPDTPSTFRCLKPGRYMLISVGGADGVARIGEQSVRTGSILSLAQGGLPFVRTEGNAPMALAWIGPTRTTFPLLPAAHRRNLFINWY